MTLVRRWRTPLLIVATAVLLAGCGGSSGASSSDPDPNNQVQVATSEKARVDGANISARLTAAGYDVIGSAPDGAGPGGFAVTFDDGGVVVVLVLDSSAQADLVATGFSQQGSGANALVRRVDRHVYAANTLGTASGTAVSKAEFDKLVAAAEG